MFKQNLSPLAISLSLQTAAFYHATEHCNIVRIARLLFANEAWLMWSQSFVLHIAFSHNIYLRYYLSWFNIRQIGTESVVLLLLNVPAKWPRFKWQRVSSWESLRWRSWNLCTILMECLKSLDLIPAREAGICPLCAMPSLNLSPDMQHSAQNFGADFFSPPLWLYLSRLKHQSCRGLLMRRESMNPSRKFLWKALVW